MSILGWLILGLLAGFIASKLVHDRGQGFILNIVLGVVGAMVGTSTVRITIRARPAATSRIEG